MSEVCCYTDTCDKTAQRNSALKSRKPTASGHGRFLEWTNSSQLVSPCQRDSLSWYNRLKKGASIIRVFAIGDLHLSLGSAKPMDIFGELWKNHEERIRTNWLRSITDEDLVLVAGDISWAMKEHEVAPDMSYLAELPGRKVLLKGNHDYWWATKKRVQALAGPKCFILQAGALEFDDFVIVGTRGWDQPGYGKPSKDDERIYHREVERLKLSLREGASFHKPLLAMMHYPPLLSDEKPTLFSTLLEEYQVRVCVYGHLHGQAHRNRVEGELCNVKYHLVSADFLQFDPLQIDLPL